jgi:signal peptidase I
MEKIKLRLKAESIRGLRIGAYIMVAMIVAILFLHFVAIRTVVEGNSMYPTLANKDQVLVDKFTYRNRDVERYDIIVFKEPMSGTGYFIKRVIAMPGETVKITTKGKILVNGKIVEDEYGFGGIIDPGQAQRTIKVKEGEYFVLGDNRNHSEDSRFAVIGNIKREDIIGRVVLRLSPISKFGYVDLYRQRKGDDAIVGYKTTMDEVASPDNEKGGE